VALMPALPTISCEAMLLGWQRSHNGGSKVTLQIPDEDLEHFEKMTVKKGKIAGQRLQCVFVEIGDDEKPVQQPATLAEAQEQAPKEKKDPLGALSKWAVMRCQDPEFQAWLRSEYSDAWELEFIKSGSGPEDLCKWVICSECGITSRKELDTSDSARALFDVKFRLPYSEANRGV
jgi:hypothetical protein